MPVISDETPYEDLPMEAKLKRLEGILKEFADRQVKLFKATNQLSSNLLERVERLEKRLGIKIELTGDQRKQ